MHKFSTVLVFLAIAAFVASRPAAAQNGHDDKKKDKESTVVVLGSDELPAGARGRIYLRPAATPEAVILVPRATVTDADLADAFRALHEMRKDVRKRDSNAASSILRMDLTVERGTRKLSEREMKAYRGYITSFGIAPEVDVPGVGKGRAVEVRVPKWP